MERMETSVYDCISKPQLEVSKSFALNTPSRQISVVTGVANGLEFLHSKGVVHCDLSPKNVLLKHESSSGISDLGVARVIEDISTHLTRCPGTPSSMPPEAFRQHYDKKLDVYSFGAVMLYMLTSEWPIPPQHPYEHSAARDLLPAVTSHKMYHLIERCLAKHHEVRPTCAEILQYLKNDCSHPKFHKPSWQEFIPGLCVRGLCKTDKCIAHAQGKVVHYHGFERLKLGTDSPRFKCPNCGAHIYPVKIVLYHCTGDIKGELWNMKTHSKEDVAFTNKDITVNPNEKRWLSLTVKNIRY